MFTAQHFEKNIIFKAYKFLQFVFRVKAT